MTETRTCPKCGAGLSPDAPAGICPRCLMQAGLGGQASAPSADRRQHAVRIARPVGRHRAPASAVSVCDPLSRDSCPTIPAAGDPRTSGPGGDGRRV